LSPPRETVKSIAPQGAVAVELLARFESLNSPEVVACDSVHFKKKNPQAPPSNLIFAIKTVANKTTTSAKGLTNGYSVVSRAYAPDQKGNR
jgi:hypothetical protein